MRDGASPQASTYVVSPMPRNFPRAADALRRSGNPAQSAVASARSRQPPGSPLSYSSITGVWYGYASGGIMLRRRISARSMPISVAATSTRRSSRKVASGRPAPRYASTGIVFVKTAFTSQ